MDALALMSASDPAWSAWPAPAKLNLFLQIVGRRADGYHLLQTVFRLLDWGDTVHVRLRTDGQIQRIGASLPGVAEDDDLMVRAARALKFKPAPRSGPSCGSTSASPPAVASVAAPRMPPPCWWP